MRHKLLTAAIATLAGLSSTAMVQADTLGFKVGGYSWSQDYEGLVQSSIDTIDQIDINDDLGFSDESGMTIYALLEHPVPLIPNLMLQRTELEITADNTLSRQITFDDVDYETSTAITSTSDLSHTDATLYYEILDNWVSLDVGLTLRQFSEGFSISSVDDSAELEIDSVIPMLYLGAEAELPLTGLFVAANANIISFEEASLTDYKIVLGYETTVGLGIEAGIRSFVIDVDDDDEQVDITIDGAFAGVYYHF